MLETVTLSTTDNGNSSGSTVNSFGTKIDNSKEEVYDVNQVKNIIIMYIQLKLINIIYSNKCFFLFF